MSQAKAECQGLSPRTPFLAPETHTPGKPLLTPLIWGRLVAGPCGLGVLVGGCRTTRVLDTGCPICPCDAAHRDPRPSKSSTELGPGFGVQVTGEREEGGAVWPAKPYLSLCEPWGPSLAGTLAQAPTAALTALPHDRLHDKAPPAASPMGWGIAWAPGTKPTKAHSRRQSGAPCPP